MTFPYCPWGSAGKTINSLEMTLLLGKTEDRRRRGDRGCDG